MSLFKELIGYYKINLYVWLITTVIGISSIGFIAMLMFIVYMRTNNILITRACGIITHTAITTIPLWFSNWKFILLKDENSYYINIKNYIVVQILTIMPIFITSSILSMAVSG